MQPTRDVVLHEVHKGEVGDEGAKGRVQRARDACGHSA